MITTDSLHDSHSVCGVEFTRAVKSGVEFMLLVSVTNEVAALG
jgi:hypothetical protein